LGTYCGYASTLLGDVLRKSSKIYGDSMDFSMLSIEINPTYARIAREIIQLAGLEHFVEVIEIDYLFGGNTVDVGTLLRQTMARNCSELTVGAELMIDFLFIDHDKQNYYSDLRRLECCGLIKEGTVVVADNVIFAQIDDYLAYVKDLASREIVTTETRKAKLEYSFALKKSDCESKYLDGIEITRYLKNPT